MVIRRFCVAVIDGESQTAKRINTIIWAINGIRIVKKQIYHTVKGF
ncbi:MAG: hypothetical protein ACLSFA_01335 [Roseburia inulinivorans]